MSALPEALPLALTAAVYPPALLVLVLLLTGRERRRLIVAYYLGGIVMVGGSGLLGLLILGAAGATVPDSPTASGWLDIVLGVALFGLAAWAWRRRTRTPEEPAADKPEGRVARWSKRATTSQKWAFALGVAMWLPSPMYLLAVKKIADSGDGTGSEVAAVAVCVAAVLLLVEATLVALLVRPDSVARGLERFHAWLKRNGWTIGALLAFAAGVYAVVEGIGALT